MSTAKISWVEEKQESTGRIFSKKNRNILNLDNRRSKDQQHGQKTLSSLKRPKLSLKNLFAS